MDKDTFPKAAELALRKLGHPSHIEVIWRTIQEDNPHIVQSTTSKRPLATLATSIIKHTVGIKLKLEFKRKFFYRSGPNTFGLKEWLSKDEIKSISNGSDTIDPIGVEGLRIPKIHWVLERNRKVVEVARKYALSKNRSLQCEACGFSFKKVYGDRGKEFIEAHHILPLSKSNGLRNTKVQDLALICSNCHRMIHREDPWLTIGELKQIIKNNR